MKRKLVVISIVLGVLALGVSAYVFRDQLGTFVRNAGRATPSVTQPAPATASPTAPEAETEQLNSELQALAAMDSTEKRIRTALTERKINEQQALLYALGSFLKPESVPAEYLGTEFPDYPKFGIPDIVQQSIDKAAALLESDTLDEVTRSQITELLQPNTQDRSLEQTVGGTYFLVHFDGSQVDRANAVLAQLEGSLAEATDTSANGLKFPFPRGDDDCENGGVDGRTDVYIKPDERVGGYFLPCYAGRTYQGGSIYIDSSQSTQVASLTAKHEFVHFLQAEYPEQRASYDSWIAEATANYLAYRVLDPEVKLGKPLYDDAAFSYIRQSATHQYSLSIPLDAFIDVYEEEATAVQYSRMLFFLYLHETLGGLPTAELIKDLWASDGSIEALEALLGGETQFFNTLTRYSIFNGVVNNKVDGYRDSLYYPPQGVDTLLRSSDGIMKDFKLSGPVDSLASYRVHVDNSYLDLGRSKGAKTARVSLGSSGNPGANFSFFAVKWYSLGKLTYRTVETNAFAAGEGVVEIPLSDGPNGSFVLTRLDLVGFSAAYDLSNQSDTYKYLVEFPNCNQNLQGDEQCGPGGGNPPPGYGPVYTDAACDNRGTCQLKHAYTLPHATCGAGTGSYVDYHRYIPGYTFETCDDLQLPQTPQFFGFDDGSDVGSGTPGICGELPRVTTPDALSAPVCFTFTIAAKSTVLTNGALTPLNLNYEVLYNDLSQYDAGLTSSPSGRAYIVGMPHNVDPNLPAPYYVRVEVPAGMQLRPDTGQSVISDDGKLWAQQSFLYYEDGTTTPTAFPQFLFEPEE